MDAATISFFALGAVGGAAVVAIAWRQRQRALGAKGRPPLGELLASALGGHVTLGMGGYNEFAPQFQAGKLRAIAVSAPQRLPNTDTPTLKEQGVDLEFVNWRGIFAQANAKPAEMKELQEAVAKAVASPEWQEILKQRGWIDQYQPADQFAAFLKEDRARIEGTLKDIGVTK